MNLVESFMVDELTAVYLTESTLSDRSMVYGVRILQRAWKEKTSVPNMVEMGPKTINLQIHCEDQTAAESLYGMLRKVVEIETLNRRATK